MDLVLPGWTLSRPDVSVLPTHRPLLCVSRASFSPSPSCPPTAFADPKPPPTLRRGPRRAGAKTGRGNRRVSAEEVAMPPRLTRVWKRTHRHRGKLSVRGSGVSSHATYNYLVVKATAASPSNYISDSCLSLFHSFLQKPPPFPSLQFPEFTPSVSIRTHRRVTTTANALLATTPEKTLKRRRCRRRVAFFLLS